MLFDFYGHAVYTMHCQSVNLSCSFPIMPHHITTHTSTTAAIANKSTDRTSSPRYKITLTPLCYSLKP